MNPVFDKLMAPSFDNFIYGIVLNDWGVELARALADATLIAEDAVGAFADIVTQSRHLLC